MPLKVDPKFIDGQMTTDAELAVETASREAADTLINQELDSITGVYQDTKEPTGFTDRTQSTISFDNSTRTFTISPVGADYSIYIQGQKILISAPLSIQIPDISGGYFFYINASGALNYLTAFSPTLFTTSAYCAYILWDENDNKAITFGEERHGIVMDGATHSYLHTTRGTQLVSGGSIGFTTTGDGSLDADSQISISDAVVTDEDIRVQIANNASPSAPFQQILSPIAQIPVYYLEGSTWRRSTATQYPLITGASRAKYNKNTAGVWSLQEAASDGKVLVSYIFATTNVTEPVIALLGQDEYTDISDAETRAAWSAISFGDLPAQEIKLMHIVMYVTDSTFTNTSKCAIREVKDLRFGADREVSATSQNTDHSNLSGLANDDHLQYLPVSGSRPMSADLDIGGNDITNVGLVDGINLPALSTEVDGKQPAGDYITALTGDVDATGPGSATATLSNTGVTPGTYNSVTVDAKGRVTDASNNGGITRYSYSTSTATSSSTTTYASITQLTTASLPIGLYKITFNGKVRSAATTTGMGFRVAAGTAVIGDVGVKWFIPQGANGVSQAYVYDQITTADNITSTSIQAANTDYIALGKGFIRVTTAGTVAIQIRSETTTAVTLQSNAVFTLELV